MAEDVHPCYACQLETRTWYITDDSGRVETVSGPGVVGKYIVIYAEDDGDILTYFNPNLTLDL